jgi:hypothetical protein
MNSTTTKMIKILVALLALLASAVASSEVNVFLCDSYNEVRRQKSLSHGQVARICFQPWSSSSSSSSQSALAIAVDSFVLSQDNSGGLEQVIVSDGEIVDSSTSDLQCDETSCVLETYFLGDFFLTGDLSVTFSSQVRIQQQQQQQSITQLRFGRASSDDTDLRRQVQGEIDIKTHPLPIKLNVRRLEASKQAIQ